MLRAFSAEFPNDNDALHLGAIWRSEEPCAPPTAVLPEPPAEAEPTEPIEIVESIELDEPVEEVPAPTASEVVLSSRAAEVIAATMTIPPPPPLPALELDLDDLLVAPPEPSPDDPWVVFVRLLVEVGSVDPATIEAAFAGDPIAAAWRALLRGESDDSSLCVLPLDEWAGARLAAILEAPAKAAQLRRELRARGVAAFGLVVEAA